MTTPAPADHWHPVWPVVVQSRPLGVFGVKVPLPAPGGNRWATDGRICWEPEHAVYLALRPHDEAVPVCRGKEADRTIWVCAVCSPPPKEEK